MLYCFFHFYGPKSPPFIYTKQRERERGNGNAVGHDSVDGKEGVGGSVWVGFFLFDSC